MLLITEVHSPTKMFSITTNACTKQWRSHRVHFFTGLQSQQRSKQESDLSRADTADTTLLQRGEPQKQMAHKRASVSCIPFLCTGLKGLSRWRAKWRLSLAKAAKHTHTHTHTHSADVLLQHLQIQLTAACTATAITWVSPSAGDKVTKK